MFHPINYPELKNPRQYGQQDQPTQVAEPDEPMPPAPVKSVLVNRRQQPESNIRQLIERLRPLVAPPRRNP